MACVVSSTVGIVDLETLQGLAQLDIAKLGEPGSHGLAYIPHPAWPPWRRNAIRQQVTARRGTSKIVSVVNDPSTESSNSFSPDRATR